MTIVAVLYPKTAESTFDHDYYLRKHIPLVQATWAAHGLEKVELMRASVTADDPPAFELIGLLSFRTLDGMQHALAISGGTVLGDIPNFTNVQPIIQVNNPVAL